MVLPLKISVVFQRRIAREFLKQQKNFIEQGKHSIVQYLRVQDLTIINYIYKSFLNWRYISLSNFILRIEAWEVLQNVKEDGLVKHIGVSNWNDNHLSNLLNDPRCKILPELNQIENHPYHVGENVIEFCKKHEILVQAYGPLGNGLSERAKGGREGNMERVLDDPNIKEIASSNQLTVAQVIMICRRKTFTPILFKTVSNLNHSYSFVFFICRFVLSGQFKKGYYLLLNQKTKVA